MTGEECEGVRVSMTEGGRQMQESDRQPVCAERVGRTGCV